MSTTTPNFNFPVPQSTDLVKDGATAIAALGTAIDTDFVDLKGGTTGQVLSKASNTDLDFSWVAQDDSNAIQNTIVDAKGDLIAASAADTPARLAVGSNGETLVADSSTSTGLRYQSGYNGNAIINGGMDIWQRGTSIAAGTSIVYSADRWQVYRQGTVAGLTISRQSSGLTGIQYCARVQRDSGNTSTASNNFNYQLETVDSYRFANATVTLSFYARAGANYSPTSGNLAAGIRSGTGTDQTQVGGFTGAVVVGSTTAALTTTWQRFTVTGTVGSTATQLGLYFYCDPTGTAGANDYFEITGVQLELGSVATAFKRSNGSGGTIQGELAACQRYYWRSQSTEISANHGYGPATNTTNAYVNVKLPVTMRVRPTAVDYSTLGLFDGVTAFAVSSLVLNTGNSGQDTVMLDCTTGGTLTAARGYILRNQASASAYVGLSAEL